MYIYFAYTHNIRIRKAYMFFEEMSITKGDQQMNDDLMKDYNVFLIEALEREQNEEEIFFLHCELAALRAVYENQLCE